ncbi:hypothetical protein INR49_000025 [Caranx melampygus]|nr:hypothetical protein INR49_000025 [Caranx melampygus]
MRPEKVHPQVTAREGTICSSAACHGAVEAGERSSSGGVKLSFQLGLCGVNAVLCVGGINGDGDEARYLSNCLMDPLKPVVVLSSVPSRRLYVVVVVVSVKPVWSRSSDANVVLSSAHRT